MRRARQVLTWGALNAGRPDHSLPGAQMRSLVLLAALAAGFLPATPISAQAVTRAADPAEMKALDWLVGRWNGAGSVSRGPGGRMDAVVRESATRHAGGHVLVLEGLGTSGT